MRISFFTLGCKLNQAETEELKTDLAQRGFIIVPFESSEDIAIIRGCGVTCDASQTTREFIRRAKRKNIYIIIAGCVENNSLPEIDFIGKTNDDIINHLLELSSTTLTTLDLNKSGLMEKSPTLTVYSPLNKRGHTGESSLHKTRLPIKIQSGCNFQCAYCAIPLFRGKSISEPTEKIINKINQATKNGYQEIILTGVNICQYDDSKSEMRNPKSGLSNLLSHVLQTTKIPRIRLGSLDPRLINDKLIHLFCCNERLMPHWHLSLQSGSNSVLKRMKRHYTIQKYQNIVNKLRVQNPLFSFTTDIIVGFPEETEEEFADTCSFVKKINFTKVHIFPYSPRPKTAAIKFKLLPDKIITERVKTLTVIANETARRYALQFIDTTRPVLFENKKGAHFYGYTPEYIKIKIKSDKKLANQIVNTTLTSNNIIIT